MEIKTIGDLINLSNKTKPNEWININIKLNEINGEIYSVIK